jgi:hypothetical protein
VNTLLTSTLPRRSVGAGNSSTQILPVFMVLNYLKQWASFRLRALASCHPVRTCIMNLLSTLRPNATNHSQARGCAAVTLSGLCKYDEATKKRGQMQ